MVWRRDKYRRFDDRARLLMNFRLGKVEIENKITNGWFQIGGNKAIRRRHVEVERRGVFGVDRDKLRDDYG